MVPSKCSSPKPLQLVEVTISWAGVGFLGFFGHSAWTIRASFTHRHRPQVLTVLWDRVELHANNTIHNLLKSKEDYLCSGCSPYSHPASCLNDEKFQQTTDSKQPSAETEHENGDLYQWETKPWAHHGHLGTIPCLTPALTQGPRSSSQAQGWNTLNAEYFWGICINSEGETNKVIVVGKWIGIIFLSWCFRELGLKNSGTHQYRVWLS